VEPLLLVVFGLVAVVLGGGAVAFALRGILAGKAKAPGASSPEPLAPMHALEDEPVGDPETVGDADTVSDAITVNASNAEEKDLTLAEKEELRALIDEGVELVESVIFEPFDVDDSDAMVRALAGCVEGLRKGAAYPSRWPDRDVAGRLLGLVWGEHLVATASWRWVRMSAGPKQGHAVVSPDRAYAVFPADVVQKLLADPSKPSTLVTVYETVRDRRVTAAPPGSRTLLA